MRIQSLAPAAALVLSVVASSALLAADLAPLTASELQARCLAYFDEPESAAARSCAAYIRGFIEGSSEVEYRSDGSDQTESFSERALRTRLGVRPHATPLYCLEGSVSLSDFIASVVSYIGDHPLYESLTASQVLYGTLRRFHRCER